MKTQIDSLLSGGVITNYHCSSACGHCLYNCSPRRSRDYLASELALEVFNKIKFCGCHRVHIGGGEPLLTPEKLYGVLEAAVKVGMGIEYIETNSSWMTSDAKGKEILINLKSLGVSTLLISISPFHNGHIPFDRVMGLVRLCQENGMGIFPWIADFIDDVSSFPTDTKHALNEYMSVFGHDYPLQVLGRYWINMGGRALQTYRPWLADKTADEIVDEASGSCRPDLLNTSHFHIDLYGNYIPGLCSGLAVEFEDLGGVLPRGKYTLLEILMDGGLQALYRWAVDKRNFRTGRDAYISKCDLCNEIRSFLVHRAPDHFPELRPQEYYYN